MRRRARYVVLLFALIATALYAAHASSRHRQPTENKGVAASRDRPKTLCQDEPERCAYVAFLCDDELLPALKVLLYSIKQTKTKHPIVVIHLDEVSQQARRDIAALADVSKVVDRIRYPFENLVKFEVGINKQCRYSKLQVWNQTDYSKVVYLDVDTAVVKSLDHMFELDVDFAGVRDIGDVINTGVLLLTPSEETFRRMMDTYETAPSYNRGDQGFINWFFAEHKDLFKTDTLDPVYNAAAKLKGFAIGAKTINDAFVHHFTAETKPWSFHHFYHGDWRINYHAESSDLGLPRIGHPTRAKLLEKQWTNSQRAYSICQSYTARHEIRSTFPQRDKYSVAISFHDAGRLSHLPRLIMHYWLSSKVHMVYVTWHTQNVRISKEVKDLERANRVKILYQDTDSLNNRFNPIKDLQTQAVFICDDDIHVPIESVDLAFEVWQRRPDVIAGFFPRMHGQRKDGSYFYEMAEAMQRYSLVLTKAMMINANYLHAYSCVLTPVVHRFVDNGNNCEDIAMNMMVSGLTGEPPVCVAGQVTDFGTSGGLSITTGFTERRDQCLQDLVDIFEKDVLVSSREYVDAYTNNTFVKESWDRFDDVVDQLSPGRTGIGAELQGFCPDAREEVKLWIDALVERPICSPPEADAEERAALIESAKRQCGSWCIWDLRSEQEQGWHLEDTCFRRVRARDSACSQFFYQRPDLILEHVVQ